MPKIIPELSERLLSEARRQLTERGYAATTVRSVAAGCGVGVGTVYNYYPSKAALAASCLLERWKKCAAEIRGVSDRAGDPEPVVRCVWDQLSAFRREFAPVFRDEEAVGEFARAFPRYHALLRAQLAEPLRRFCTDDFTADFVADALLSGSSEGTDFARLYGVLKRLLSPTANDESERANN